jgi:hypothetical protein
VALSALTKKASTIVVLAALCFMFDLFFLGLTGAPMGTVHASLDRVLGNLRTKTYGHHHPVIYEYQKLMSERYKVSIDHITGCTPSPWERSYVKAYNAISRPAIEKKYGRDVFDESFSEAAQAFEAKYRRRDVETHPTVSGQK